MRPLANIALKINFRKIYLSNTQVLPRDKPVILAANHPSAFLEPCLLACLLPRPLYFLARGDIFVKPFYIRILEALHIIPIYRLKDRGYTYVKKNYDSFELCYEAFKEKKVVMILAEGGTVHEKRLRPIQKGTARLAFGALETYADMDLQVVPVGVNYTYADKFRSRVMIQMGQPIAVKDYWATYQKSPNRAVKQLTDQLREALEKDIIIIDKKEDEELVENLMFLSRNDLPDIAFPVVSPNNHLLKREKQIADKVNQSTEEDKKNWSSTIKDYQDTLTKQGVTDHAVAIGKLPQASSWLIVLFGSLPYLIGWLGNLLPGVFAHYIASTKVEEIEFKASVRLAFGVLVYILYYLTFITIAALTGHFLWILLVFLLPFFGYYALMYREYFKKWRSLQTLRKIKSDLLKSLQGKRKAILAKLD